MFGTLLSLIPTIAGLFGSNNAHDQYSAALNRIRQQQQISPAALQAKSLYAENATRGLPGYETMKEDINNTLPTTLNESKDWLTGSGAVDFLARSKATTDKQLRDLNSANEAEKLGNMSKYAGFLSGPMAGFENQFQQDQNQLGIAGAYNKVDKTAVATKTLGGMGNALASIADKDWAAIIAALSGSPYKFDPTTGKNYGIPAGPSSNPYSP